MENKISYERYHRQIILKQFGEGGQYKLLQAKVLVAGAGGLGCPILQYLAAAGVGTLGVVDDDVVSLSNLHRQLLYNMHDLGLLKAERAAFVLQQLNPEIIINVYTERLTAKNALDIISEYDIIVDGTDNFSTRYIINDACVLLNKPLVYGAASQFEGQVAVFNVHQQNGEQPVNYRDLFPQPPKDDEVLNCGEAGVLGVVPGIIGTMQANEAIKLITGIGEPLLNRMLAYNALNNQIYELVLSARKDTSSLIPLDAEAFKATDYELLCSLPAKIFEMDAQQFNMMLEAGDAAIIDVREQGEDPAITEFAHIKIPLSKLKVTSNDIAGDVIVVFCQSGKRSHQAAQHLHEVFGTGKKFIV